MVFFHSFLYNKEKRNRKKTAVNKENKWQVTGRVVSNLIVVFAGVAFYMALSNFDALRAQLRAWLGILSPFVWGLVIAYLLDAPVRFFESKLGGRRKLSILISYVLAFLVVGFLLRMVLPQIGNGFISAVTALISSVYMLMGKDRLLRKAVLALLPLPRARSVLEVCSRANRVFGGFIIGKIIDSSIIGVLCFVCMTLLRLPFAVLISVIVGVTNIIPFFGPFIGAVPSILILLIVDPIAALKFAVFVLLLQQFDGNILGPEILGDSTGLSALWVLVAIIVSGGLFGFAGMVVGVPVFAVLYALASSFFARRLWEKGIDEEGNPLPPADAS